MQNPMVKVSKIKKVLKVLLYRPTICTGFTMNALSKIKKFSCSLTVIIIVVVVVCFYSHPKETIDNN